MKTVPTFVSTHVKQSTGARIVAVARNSANSIRAKDATTMERGRNLRQSVSIARQRLENTLIWRYFQSLFYSPVSVPVLQLFSL